MVYDNDHRVLMLELFNNMCYSVAGANTTILAPPDPLNWRNIDK